MTRARKGVRSGRLLLLVAAIVAVLWAMRPEAVPPGAGAWLRQSGLIPRFETVSGLRIRYVRTGAGPTVVLLHGIASSLYTWKDVIPALARTHDVVAVDLPGFGESDRPAGLRWDGLAPVVLGLMERLGIEKASVAGNSMGGAVAVLLASQAAGKVEKLVLIDAAGFNLAPEDRPRVLWLLTTPAGPLVGRLPIRRQLARLALRQIFHDDTLVTPEKLDEYTGPLLQRGAYESMRSLLTSAGGDDAARFESAARSVRSPTLVVWGAEDQWLPLRDADRFVGSIPGARKVVIPACGHMPQEEKPAEVVGLLLPFLARSIEAQATEAGA